MKKMTQAWVKKAEADYQVAIKLYRGADPFHDQLCFHCQQSAEKYLKALMEELGLVIPKVHNLDDIGILLRPYHNFVRSLRTGLIYLTDFAVGFRYPGREAHKRQSTAALRWASKVRDACRAILKIRPPKRRKSK